MSASNYLENEILDHILGQGARDFTSPANLYVGLFTTDPTDAGTGTEVSGGSYARTAVAFDAAASGSASNTANVTFTTATADWGTVTHAAVYDAASGGNMLFHGGLTTSKSVTNGDTFQISAGQLTITLD